MGLELSAFIKRYIKSEAGSILPLTAGLLPVIVGAAGIGVDVGSWVMTKRSLQTAADAAVVAAAWEIANGHGDYAEFAGMKEARNNGFVDGGSNVLDLVIDDSSGATIVTARIRQKARVYFSQILFRDDVFVANAAASAVIDSGGGFCMLSLDESASGAITTSGAVEINAAGCGMAMNSGADDALSLNGAVDINIGDVSIAGGYKVKGGAAKFNYATMKTKASRTRDPYADLENDQESSCSKNDSKSPVKVSQSETLKPGVYCGGLDISGNVNITFEPGVYVIDGGDFSVSGAGSLYGEGVTFILTNSGNGEYGNINISGGKKIDFTAPAEGEPWEGIVIYQDAPEDSSSKQNKFTGTSEINITGVIYTPNRGISFGGNNSTSGNDPEVCTKVIAKTITLHGNPAFGNACEGTGVRDIGTYSVKLIM